MTPLAETGLNHSFWRFTNSNTGLIAPVLVLLADGTIGVHQRANERRWTVEDGCLNFLNADGITTVVFDQPLYSGDETPVGFHGRIRHQPEANAVLERISPPALEPWPKDPWHGRHTEWHHGPPTCRRSNVVVLCANDKSLHAQWLNDIEFEQRNWDLCITCYSDNPSDIALPYEYLTHQHRQPKWRALFNLFPPESPLWQYDYIWLPDDDLMTTWADINRLFELCRRHSLLLAQPSIDPSSNVNHHITQTDNNYLLRFTNFVEIMCPVFSRDALRIAILTFRDTASGYGLDNLWPALLGGVAGRVAVIDAISVAHTRPLGRNYDGEAAVREGKAMQTLYSAFSGQDVLGSLLKTF
jgi:hypothetical protein